MEKKEFKKISQSVRRVLMSCKECKERIKELENENRDLKSSLLFTNGILKEFRKRLNKANKELRKYEKKHE